MNEKKECHLCKKEINGKYIQFEEEAYCSNCYESETVVSYFVEGEHFADDVDGVTEHDTERVPPC